MSISKRVETASRIFKVTLQIDNDEAEDVGNEARGAAESDEEEIDTRIESIGVKSKKIENRPFQLPLIKEDTMMRRAKSAFNISEMANELAIQTEFDSEGEGRAPQEIESPRFFPHRFSVAIISTDIVPDVRKPYTLYICQIEYEGKGWLVQRRYREFRALHKKLKEKFDFARHFHFPPKKMLNKRQRVVNSRKRKFEGYLRLVLEHAINDEDVQKFLEVNKTLKSARAAAYENDLIIDDFERIALLGRGGSGEVHLCRLKKSGEILAVKRVAKSELYRRNQISYAETEHDVLVLTSKETSIVRLVYTFQDDESLYFALEWCCGGDIRTYTHNIGPLDEEKAAFYFMEMLNSVNTLHRLGYIHRDLKPENFLICSTGHIKLADFGLSTRGVVVPQSKNKGESIDHQRLLSEEAALETTHKGGSSVDLRAMGYSIVGSPMYMAPEIILQEGYSSNVDWWSLGCILYELLSGRPAFFSKERKKLLDMIVSFRETFKYPTYHSILFDRYGGSSVEGSTHTDFSVDDRSEEPFTVSSDTDGGSEPEESPNYAPISDVNIDISMLDLEAGPISPVAWDLISKLICNKKDRIGFNEIKNHEFFSELDWEKLELMVPPFIPQLESETDTFYFQKYVVVDD